MTEPGSPISPQVPFLHQVKRTSERHFKDKRKRWKEYLFGGVVFVLLMSRIIKLHMDRRELLHRLVDKYEVSGQIDGKLQKSEVANFLRDNGVNLTKDQFNEWVGYIDNENDGFDQSELVEAAEVFEDFKNASSKLIEIGDEPWVMVIGDAFLVVAFAIGLLWVLSGSEAMERKVAANSFVSAVRMSRTQRKWQTLEAQMMTYESARVLLESRSASISDASREASERAKEFEEQLRSEQAKASATEESLRVAEDERKRLLQAAREAEDRLAQHMHKVEAAKSKEDKIQVELAELRRATEKHMQEAHMSTNKLKAMTSVLRGVNAIGAQSPFKGAGTGKYAEKGATCGFAVKQSRVGFRMESFVFGYPTEDNIEFFEVDRKRDLLGEGADCAYKCRNIATNEQLALKIYEIGQGTHRRQILSDLNAHQDTQDHPHIVKYKGVIETQDQIFVLMELIQGVDLFSDIIDRQGLEEKRAARILRQLCGAIGFLHDQDIIHGDIKPENVMLESPKSDEPTVKLIDFGFSVFLNRDVVDHRGIVPCTMNLVADVYAPPEALGALGLGEKMTKGVDMFRLGCCLYVMLMATYPFDRSCKDLEARTNGKVIQYPRWKTLSAEAQDLIVQLTRDRITVKQVLEHPWLVTNS